MLTTQILLQLTAYNLQANRRILEKAGLLSDAQFRQQPAPEARSLHELLLHMLRTEWTWRNLAQHGQLPGLPPQHKNDFGDTAALQAGFEAENRLWRTYLEGLDEQTLAESLNLCDPKGNEHTFARWQMLLHGLLHSHQHRSEAALLLTSFGQSPGDLDFIFYC